MKKKIVSSLLALVMLLALPMTVFAASKKTYGEDFFPVDYAKGYIRLNATGVECIPSSAVKGPYTGGWGDNTYTYFWADNTSKDSSIYIDFINGACYDSELLDVRIYLWCNNTSAGSKDNWWAMTSGGLLVHDQPTNGDQVWADAKYRTSMQFHFYRKKADGTSQVGKSAYETSVQGVMRFNDLDAGEGYEITHGLKNIYVATPTKVTVDTTNNYVYGTRVTAGSDESDDRDRAWITFDATPDEPFTLRYWTRGHYTSRIHYVGQTVKYKIVGKTPLSQSIKISSENVAEWGKYVLRTVDDEIGSSYYAQQFIGWTERTAGDRTELAPAMVMNLTTGGMSLYGSFTYNIFLFNGEGGDIYFSGEDIGEGLPAGSNHTYDIVPHPGYYIKNINVQYRDLDGELQTKATYGPDTIALGDSYTLNIKGLDRNYEISAEYDTIVNLSTSVLNGTISPEEGTHKYPYGSNATVTYQPISERYDLDKIYIDGVDTDFSDIMSQYIFENMTEDHEIRVEYQPWYEITTEVVNGTITDDESHIRVGSDRTVSYAPLNDNFRLTSIKVDGESVSLDDYTSDYAFNNISADHHVAVVYQPYRSGTIHFIDTDNNELASPVDYEMIGDRADFNPSATLTAYTNATNGILDDGYSLISDEVADRDQDEDGNGFLDSAVGSHKDLYVVFEGYRYGVIHYVDTEGNKLADDTTYSNAGNIDNFDDSVTLAAYTQNSANLTARGYVVVSDDVADRNGWFLPAINSTKEMTVVFELQPPVMTGIQDYPAAVFCIMCLAVFGIVLSVYIKKSPEEGETEE